MEIQSTNLPGSAGPLETFLRSTTFAVLSRSFADSIIKFAITVALSTFEFNHKEKRSETIPSTIEAI